MYEAGHQKPRQGGSWHGLKSLQERVAAPGPCCYLAVFRFLLKFASRFRLRVEEKDFL